MKAMSPAAIEVLCALPENIRFNAIDEYYDSRLADKMRTLMEKSKKSTTISIPEDMITSYLTKANIMTVGSAL
jgi:hypothetical protein